MPQAESLQVWFKASQFRITPGEDAETNPLCYGKELATWIRGKLVALGYTVEDVIPEDWGWCVMCQRKPFMLWVGCSNIRGYAKSESEDSPLRGIEVIWSCIVVAEVSLLGRLFKRPDTGTAACKLFADVKHVLSAEPDIVFVEEP